MIKDSNKTIESNLTFKIKNKENIFHEISWKSLMSICGKDLPLTFSQKQNNILEYNKKQKVTERRQTYPLIDNTIY